MIAPVRAKLGRNGNMTDETSDANAAWRRYWNTVAGPRWAAAPEFRERRNQESISLLLARLPIGGGERVLEIGCGTGALTLPLASALGEGGRVVGVDISEPMLSVARQRVAECGLQNVTMNWFGLGSKRSVQNRRFSRAKSPGFPIRVSIVRMDAAIARCDTGVWKGTAASAAAFSRNNRVSTIS